MKLTTRIDQLNRSELRQLGKDCLDFCKNELGVNRRHSNDISFHIQKFRGKFPQSVLFLGEYNPMNNKIFIFKNNVTNVKSFILTFIHEYVHSLQPIKTKYYSLLFLHGYQEHPFEIEANLISEQLYKQFWKSYKIKQ